MSRTPLHIAERRYANKKRLTGGDEIPPPFEVDSVSRVGDQFILTMRTAPQFSGDVQMCGYNLSADEVHHLRDAYGDMKDVPLGPFSANTICQIPIDVSGVEGRFYTEEAVNVTEADTEAAGIAEHGAESSDGEAAGAAGPIEIVYGFDFHLPRTQANPEPTVFFTFAWVNGKAVNTERTLRGDEDYRSVLGKRTRD